MKGRPMKSHVIAATAIIFGLLAGQASAGSPTNDAPPAGPVIFDLAGTPIPHSYEHYTTSFVATSTSTNLSFAFRDDPSFLLLDGVTVTTGGGPNIVTDGGFESGPVNGAAPVGWNYLNSFGASYGGKVQSGCGTPGNCYEDGAVQAYDSITQVLTTVVGAVYTVGFYLNEIGNQLTFSSVSTNGNSTGIGGNGIDLVVYAGGLPTALPEVSSIGPFALGLFGLGFARHFGRTAQRRALLLLQTTA